MENYFEAGCAYLGCHKSTCAAISIEIAIGILENFFDASCPYPGSHRNTWAAVSIDITIGIPGKLL